MRSFTYHFDTGDETHQYTHTIGAPIDLTSLPHWTTLEFQDCAGCRNLGHQHCLAAATLAEPSQLLGKLKSFEPVSVTVKTEQRTYYKETTAQEALSSLFGLIMASSGCPSFKFLKGLAHYHLPFASFEETLFRVLSGYLVSQQLSESPAPADQLMQQLSDFYDQIKHTTITMTHRLRKGAAPLTDSSTNAIVILDSFGSLVPITLEDGLKRLRSEFF